MKTIKIRNSCRDNKIVSLFVLGIILTIVNGASGKSPSRISGGTLAMPGEFKYLVAIMDNGRQICGGTIISKRHILTAGHCVEKKDVERLSVVAGTNDIEGPHDRVHYVSKIFMHPEFIPYTKTTNMECDVAVIVLEDDLELGKDLEMLALPTFQVGPGHIAIVAGWGYTSSYNDETFLLHKLSVTFLNERNCVATGSTLTPDRLCGFQTYGTICGGDSGSSLVIGREVVGIASASNCVVGNSHIYVNVYYYRDWIEEVMSRSQRTP